VCPLKNGEISEEEMAEIRASYDEIFATCARTPGGFEHEPDRRGFYEVSREERVALWERLYGEPGFGIWLSNFREIFIDEKSSASPRLESVRAIRTTTLTSSCTQPDSTP
jgi:cyclohexanone monooxygenase